MTQAWFQRGLLATAYYLYALYVAVSDEPFFIGTKMLKHKPVEWLYLTFSASILAAVLLAIAVLLTKLAHTAYVTRSEPEASGLTTVYFSLGILNRPGF